MSPLAPKDTFEAIPPVAVAWYQVPLDGWKTASTVGLSTPAYWGLLVSGWALYTSAEYTWLHRGEHLGPSNWGRAFTKLAEFFPLGHPFSALFAAACAVLVVVALGLTALACSVTGPYGLRDLQRPPAEVISPV
jgi:hypothetical protein